MTYAVYRCLYGEDFIQESIKSIEPYVDKIFVFWTNQVWGHCTHCVYKDDLVRFPEKFDNVVEKIQELNDPKVHLIEAYTQTPVNQLTHFVNRYVIPDHGKPDLLIIPEVDHVFKRSEIEKALVEFEQSDFKVATTTPVELWKTPEYRIPGRNRNGTIFWDLTDLDAMPNTRTGGDTITHHSGAHPSLQHPFAMQRLSAVTHNFGFAVSDQTMYWKHLTALAFSSVIGDNTPNEDWLEEKWRTWDFETNNTDLEIADGHASNIPHAIEYDTDLLPELIKEKYNL